MLPLPKVPEILCFEILWLDLFSVLTSYMNTIHIKTCPVCSSDDFTKSLECKDHLLTNELFAIYSCKRCIFSFTQDFPSESEIGKYYEASDYVSHSDTQKGLINKLYHLARSIALRSKTRLVLKYFRDQPGTLLDVGCGTGYFLDSMRKKEWVVTGIEKSESTRNFAKQKFGLNTQDSEYLHTISNKAKNVITLWHVLEHIEKLNETMGTFYRILKDDGILVLALPNKSSVDARYYKDNWAAYDVPRHLWHFSPENLKLLAEKHNFELIAEKTMLFDPVYISMLSEKNRSAFLAGLRGMIKGTFFSFLSLFDTHKCSSIIYVLKKK